MFGSLPLGNHPNVPDDDVMSLVGNSRASSRAEVCVAGLDPRDPPQPLETRIITPTSEENDAAEDDDPAYRTFEQRRSIFQQWQPEPTVSDLDRNLREMVHAELRIEHNLELERQEQRHQLEMQALQARRNQEDHHRHI